jgi:integrase
MASRRPNGASSVYLGSDGSWHGRVTVGFKDDGSPDRRHVRGGTQAAVIKKVRTLEKQRELGAVPTSAARWTVATWLEHWLENIARPGLRYRSYDAYRIAVQRHLVPNLGQHRLDRLLPEHLERLYRRMIERGARPATAHQVHRTARTALGEAVRRGHVTQNVAALAKAPRVEVEEIEPYSVDEVRRILDAADGSPNAARWAVALALGLRQGEVLGLRWCDVDLERGMLSIRKNRLRPLYQHGCLKSCGLTPGRCPDRVRGNDETGPTKSRAGRRVVGVPESLAELLRRHRAQQELDRERARQLWVDGDFVFTSKVGEPLNPNTDYHAWKALTKRAGVRDARLHDARHTAATVLLVLGVPERTVMEVMGWSTTSMAARYQHVTDPIRRHVASQVGGLLWASQTGNETGTETRS